MKIEDVCSVCKKEIITDSDHIGTGYGVNKADEKVCYACCAIQDKKQLLETGILSGYLSKNAEGCATYKFGNWPSSFTVDVYNFKFSHHNFAGRNGRIDFWFGLEGQRFHGVQIGHDNECATVRRVKLK